jgi:hypothetical protein
LRVGGDDPVAGRTVVDAANGAVRSLLRGCILRSVSVEHNPGAMRKRSPFAVRDGVVSVRARDGLAYRGSALTEGFASR